MQSMLLVVSSAKEAIEKLQVYVDLGFTEVVITNSSPDQTKLVNVLAKEVIPHFSRSQ
jgi:2-keto-3-deoxy-6-phosphogluconate aldolase